MKKVMMMIDTSRLTGRELLSGAERYISAFTRWEVHTLSPNYLKRDLENLNLKGFDGFFVCFAEGIDPVLKIKKPKIIHHTPKEVLPNASLIITGSSQIGRMAADYLVSLGLMNYTFCGFKGIGWSDERHDSYEQKLRELGITPIVGYIDVPTRSKAVDRQRLTTWLKNLPKPVGIFACNDDRAISILEACKANQINVPEEVAVLGVDNDSLICNLSSPPLSSIALNFDAIGYLAAQHLDKMIMGQAEDATFYVDPVEVVARKSTDVLAVQDKELVAAVQFVRANFEKPILVDDVVKATNLSRRELEYRFKHTLKRTIKSEIERLRIDYIKKKLMNSRQPIYQIARMLEFIDPEHFSRYFKHHTGIRPSEFRQTYGLAAETGEG